MYEYNSTLKSIGRYAVLPLLILVVLWMLLVFTLNTLSSQQTGNEVSVNHLRCDESKKTLIVTLHGLGGHGERMMQAVEAARNVVTDANILEMNYKTGLLSNSQPAGIARSVELAINRHFMECQNQGLDYENVILIGYSAGALITRSAYLIGLGATTGEGLLDSGAARPVQAWSKQVSRIVLLAGMNRGWTLDRRPDGLNWFLWKSAGLLRVISEFAGVSKFLYQLERGAPFVADLRLSWLRQAAVSSGNFSFPTVVQLLGSNDELVTRDDETDLAVSKDFVYIDAGDVRHDTILDHLNDSSMASTAYREALGMDTRQLVALHRRNIQTYPEYDGLDRVLIVRHGIRDDNDWGKALSDHLCKKAKASGQFCVKTGAISTGQSTIRVDVGSYGYFGMLPFLFESIRQDKVKKFVDDYTEILSRASNPDIPVDFLGHSNGTYLLAAALKQYSSIKVNRVAFANSVVPRQYDWGEEIGHQVKGPIVNFTGSEDYVVAIFPRLFELHPALGDLGSAGFKGFTDGVAAERNIKLGGGHGVGIDKNNWSNIANFFFSDVINQVPAASNNTDSEETSTLANVIDFFWKLPYLAWAIVILFVCGVGLLFFKGLEKFNPMLSPKYWMVLRGVLSIMLVVVILNRI